MRVQFREIDLLSVFRAQRDGGYVEFVKNYAGLWLAMFAVFCYGLLLPTDWASSPLFGPIRMAAQYVPVVGNFAEASAIPDFVRGFLGFVVYLPPCFGLYFFCKRNIERTEPGSITVLVRSPEPPAYSTTPTMTAFMNRHPLFRAAFGLLLMGCMVLMLYVGQSADQLERLCDRGGHDHHYCLTLFLLQDRLRLSLFGALFTPFPGLFMYIWLDFAVQFWVALTGADVLAPRHKTGPRW